MPLFKPNPGDPMYSAHAREHAIYSESNHVRVGPGLTCRRTLAGTSINLTGALRASGAIGGSDSSGGVAGYTDGEKRWGRVAYIESSHKFVQFQETYSVESSAWVEDATGTDITTFISHDTAHGV